VHHHALGRDRGDPRDRLGAGRATSPRVLSLQELHETPAAGAPGRRGHERSGSADHRAVRPPRGEIVAKPRSRCLPGAVGHGSRRPRSAIRASSTCWPPRADGAEGPRSDRSSRGVLVRARANGGWSSCSRTLAPAPTPRLSSETGRGCGSQARWASASRTRGRPSPLLVGGGIGIAPLAGWQDEVGGPALLGFRSAAHAAAGDLLATSTWRPTTAAPATRAWSPTCSRTH